MRAVAAAVVVIGFAAGCATVLGIDPVPEPTLADASTSGADATTASDATTGANDAGDGAVAVGVSVHCPLPAPFAPTNRDWTCEGSGDCAASQLCCSTIGEAAPRDSCPIAVSTGGNSPAFSTCTAADGNGRCPVGVAGQTQLCRTREECAPGTQCEGMDVSFGGVEGGVGVCVPDASVY